MRILITGGTGLLGKALVETSTEKLGIIATYIGAYNMTDSDRLQYKKLDLLDTEGYKSLFSEFKPGVVIHTAGVSNPDFAQGNKEFTWKVNILGTQNLISCCKLFHAKFVYVSSNAIYDGNNAPYREKDEAVPMNYYGMIKLEAERITRNSGLVYAIVRPILMYGWNHHFERENIVTLSLHKLRKKEEVFIYDDVFCNPLLSQFCAQAIWEIVEKGLYDTFNIAGQDKISIFQLIKTAAEIFGLEKNLVKPVQQGFFSELIRRPRDTSYRTEKMQNILGLRPLTVKEGLEAMREQEPRNV